MGALPDHVPPVGAPRRDPQAAPPLRAVPRPAGPSTPEPEPGPAPPAQARDRPQEQPENENESENTQDCDQPQEPAPPGMDVQTLHRLRSALLGQLAQADLWSASLPPLSHIWQRALAGEHLPAHPVLRVGEIARLVVSLPLAWCAGLLAWCLVSAPRTAALAAGALSAWLVGRTVVSAAAELLL